LKKIFLKGPKKIKIKIRGKTLIFFWKNLGLGGAMDPPSPHLATPLHMTLIDLFI
jgi:hypothetical protein